MADAERDARVSERYRALGREDPAPEIDAAILAASRRRRSRWAVPVSVAAVVALAVGVTLRVQMEDRRGAEEVVLSPQVMQTPPPAAAPARKAARDAAPLPESEPARPEARREMRTMQALATPPVAAAPAEQAASGVAVGKISAAPETPEQWLERIAKLRAAGKDREADDSLAEFKRRFPDYRIPEKMRARIAPR